MKKISIVLLLVFSCFIVYAQNVDIAKAILSMDNNEIFERVGLSEYQIDEINQAKYEAILILAQARVELNECRFFLEQELYYDNVDLNKVEDILVKSHELRLKTELAEIELYIKIRQIITRERLLQLVFEIYTYIEQHPEHQVPYIYIY